MKAKYVLNTNTNTLHLTGKCRYSNPPFPEEWKYYKNLEGVTECNTNFFKKCKFCFKNE